MRQLSILSSLVLLSQILPTSSAQAAMISRIGDADICGIMSSIGRQAAEMRQSGASQRQAAQFVGSTIGSALSDGAGSQAARQRLASLIAQEATGIVRLVYSVPIGRSAGERAAWVETAETYVYNYCMGAAD